MVDFIVIGAQKAGSSSLHFLLNQHPDICLTTTKEVNYFTKNFDKKSPIWYENQFKDSTKLLGDVSPSYSKRHHFPDIAKRVYEYNPKMKIVYLIRDPFKRINSHLYHDLVTDRLKTQNDYNLHLTKESDYIQTSSYFYQISEYLNYFSKDSIFILNSEELNNPTSQEWLNLMKFLNVDFNVNIEMKKYNVSLNKRRIKYYTFVYKYLNYKIFREVYFRIARFFGEQIVKPTLTTANKELISKLLIDDYKQFDKTFNLNISKWLY